MLHLASTARSKARALPPHPGRAGCQPGAPAVFSTGQETAPTHSRGAGTLPPPSSKSTAGLGRPVRYRTASERCHGEQTDPTPCAGDTRAHIAPPASDQPPGLGDMSVFAWTPPLPSCSEHPVPGTQNNAATPGNFLLQSLPAISFRIYVSPRCFLATSKDLSQTDDYEGYLRELTPVCNTTPFSYSKLGFSPSPPEQMLERGQNTSPSLRLTRSGQGPLAVSSSERKQKHNLENSRISPVPSA